MTGYRWAWNSPRLPSRTRPLAATFAPAKIDQAATEVALSAAAAREAKSLLVSPTTDFYSDVWSYPQIA